jgi:hypothetical protein
LFMVAGCRRFYKGLSRPGVAAAVVSVFIATSAVAAVAADEHDRPVDDLSKPDPGVRLAEGDDVAGPMATGRGAEQLLEKLREEEERAAELKRRSASPEWREQRLESRTEFVGISDANALALAQAQFGEALRGAGARSSFEDLARGRPVRKFVDDRTVVLAGKGDLPPVLVESSWPMRAVDDDGQKRLVDLSLERDGGDFVPSNGISDVRLPDGLGEGRGFDVGPVRVVPAGVAEGDVVGEDGGSVIYPNAEMDTDVIVTPIDRGVEVFWQLRSPRAAEQLILGLEVPKGAFVEAKEDGSAVVTRDGKTLTIVRPPMAFDAQGADVPVELDVRGQQLVLSLSHRDADIAYPVLVDPLIEDYWMDWYGAWIDQNPYVLSRIWQDWSVTHSGPVQYNDYAPRDDCYEVIYAPSHCDGYIGRESTYDYWLPDGLHYYVRSGFNYPANSAAWWVYRAPGTTTKIPDAWFYSFYHRRGGSQYPAMVSGIWNDQQWIHNRIYTMDHVGTEAFTGGANYSGAQSFVFGFWTPNGVTNGNWRDGYIGAARLTLTDPEAPTIVDPGLRRYDNDSTPDLPAPAADTHRWISDDAFFEIQPDVRDPGLGVYHLRLFGSNVGDQYETLDCIGTREAPCPAQVTQWGTWPDPHFGVYTGATSTQSALPEGRNVYALHAQDPLLQTGQLGFEIKVDRGRPVMALSGALYAAKEVTPAPPGGQQILEPGSYALNVQATDNAVGSGPAGDRSGVEKLEVQVDGDTVYDNNGECSSANCSRNLSWSFNTIDYGGRRTIKVVATDGAGNVKTESFVVNAPARGELTLPVEGETTTSRIALQAQAAADGPTGVTFQYRSMNNGAVPPLPGAWTTVDSAGTMLTDSRGVDITSNIQPLSEPNRSTKKLIWDVRTALALLNPKPGQIQLRAIFHSPS